MPAPNSPNLPTHDTKPGGLSWLIWLPLVLLILYVLSVGPLVRYYVYVRNTAAPPAIGTFYHPIFVLADHLPPFGSFMDWYMYRLWLGMPGRPSPTPTATAPPTSNTTTN